MRYYYMHDDMNASDLTPGENAFIVLCTFLVFASIIIIPIGIIVLCVLFAKNMHNLYIRHGYTGKTLLIPGYNLFVASKIITNNGFVLPIIAGIYVGVYVGCAIMGDVIYDPSPTVSTILGILSLIVVVCVYYFNYKFLQGFGHGILTTILAFLPATVGLTFIYFLLNTKRFTGYMKEDH